MSSAKRRYAQPWATQSATGSSVIGGPSSAAPKRAKPSRQTASSSSSMLPKWVYTAIVDAPISLANRRAVTASRPSSDSTRAAASRSRSATSGFRVLAT